VTRICALDKNLQAGSIFGHEPFLILELLHQKNPGLEEEMHCIHHKLCLGIRVLPKNCHFLALLKMLEEAFWHIIMQESRLEDLVVVPQGGTGRLAIRRLEQRQYHLDAHHWIPTLEVGIVGHLEDIIDVFVRHAQQGAVYVAI
jgi:hypothetical protein